MRECLGQTPPGRFAPDSYRDIPLEGGVNCRYKNNYSYLQE